MTIYQILMTKYKRLFTNDYQISTNSYVRNYKQIMQNKPNFENDKMDISLDLAKDYKEYTDNTHGKTNPNKANFKRGIYSLTGQSRFITMVADKIGKIYGGDWCLVVPLVFKASVGLIRSRVGSIPIRLRHLFPGRIKQDYLLVLGRY